MDAKKGGRKDIKLLSEDTVCFFLAAAFLQDQVSPSSIEMEVHHPTLPPESYSAVDVCVHHPDGDIWIEVKLDKTAPGFHTHLGYFLNDICRLALIREGKSFMLYVAANGMVDRLQKWDSRFVGTDPIFLDASFFGKLHMDTKKRIKEKVRADLNDGAITSVRLVNSPEGHTPVCLLYEINAHG
jgi:hypothetical protein